MRRQSARLDIGSADVRDDDAGGWRVAAGAALIFAFAVAANAQSLTHVNPRERDRAAQNQRLEGRAVLALADAAMAGKSSPADFRIHWQNEFLKAQQGTFVPFTVTLEAPAPLPTAALMYVRAVSKRPATAASSGKSKPDRKAAAPDYAVDAIFPVDLSPDARVVRVSRGFSVAPGDYDVYVVIRERAAPVTKAPPRASVLVQTLNVPDFWGHELTTSSVILADRLDVLTEPIEAEDLPERPYVIGQNDITPAADAVFRKDEELVIVFLVYNPSVEEDRRFDVQVEYHFYRRVLPGSKLEGTAVAVAHPPERDGERYFNHTEPQRFNPSTMGSQFDPGSGRPVLAGQGVPLAGFDAGDYRLAIKVTDLLSGKSVIRDVLFTVGS